MHKHTPCPVSYISNTQTFTKSRKTLMHNNGGGGSLEFITSVEYHGPVFKTCSLVPLACGHMGRYVMLNIKGATVPSESRCSPPGVWLAPGCFAWPLSMLSHWCRTVGDAFNMALSPIEQWGTQGSNLIPASCPTRLHAHSLPYVGRWCGWGGARCVSVCARVFPRCNHTCISVCGVDVSEHASVWVSP